MKNVFIQSFKLLIMAAVQLAIVFLLSQNEKLSFLIHESAYMMVGFLAISMFLIHLLNIKAFKSDTYERGGQLFAAITTRLLLSMSFVLVMAYLGIEDKLTFIFNFFVLYLSYMLFEIITIMSNLREISAGTDKASKND
ncbi:hypothetical protein JKA74_12430 [Marivirga sp. S37H4]|uniref:Uncharacterized protein n=1 Tax=Marivirga aurantiaca TaxID=2802615 RepID=A0A935C9W2_9BACT|nr:hypothetical protein [Marivirga aurantiaca]MBK6265842.1 hypothetical protein [Marivirga aurantiaca]